jgi:outer membrane protein
MKTGKALMICYAVVQMSLNSSAQSTPITLKQCVETAIANNADVRQRDLQMQREAINWRQGKGNFLPNINGYVGHNLNQGRTINTATNSFVTESNTSASWDLSGDITLFNGLRLLNNLKSTQYAYEASRMELQQQKDKLTLDVILAYLDILTNMDLLDQAKKQYVVSQKQVERLEIMNKEGAVKPSDLTDLRGLMADNKISIVNNENNLNSSKLALQQLMNIPSTKNFEVEKMTAEQFAMDYNISADSIYQAALQQLAMVKATQLRVKSSEKNVQAVRGNMLPRVSLGGGINSNYNSIFTDSSGGKIGYYDQVFKNNYGTNIGIGVNIPILNYLQRRNSVSLAKISKKEAELTAQTTLIQLKQGIERDHFNMEASLNRYQAQVDQVTAYTESFRAAEIRFNEGASTSVDYLVSKNNLDRANINLIIARYDYVLRTKILDYYQGKMNW